MGLRWAPLPLLVGLGVALWLLGLAAHAAAGWALLAGVAAGAVWSLLFVDWEPKADGEPR